MDILVLNINKKPSLTPFRSKKKRNREVDLMNES